MNMYMQKDHTRTLKSLESISELGELWKHQNSPACTKGVRVFSVLKLDIMQKKKWPKVSAAVPSSYVPVVADC